MNNQMAESIQRLVDSNPANWVVRYKTLFVSPPADPRWCHPPLNT